LHVKESTMPDYLRDLAQALRERGLSGEATADALREIQSESKASGRPADEVFGPADQYARTFQRGKAWSGGRIVISFAMAVAVAATAIQVVASLVLRVSLPLAQRIGVPAAAVVLVFVAAIIGAQIDRRLPKELR
jgi:hypothetical protein